MTQHPHYWKVRAAQLRVELVATQAKLNIANADAALRDAMVAAGLDPRADCRLEDADESITVRERVSPPHEPPG